MRIEINGDGLRTELMLTHKYQAAFQKAVPADVDKVSRQTMWKVKRVMPVDTGRARATWGIFSPELVVYVSTKNPLNANDAIWEVEDGGLTIKQGADLRPYNYIDELNAGSSKQAPSMFLDVIAEQAADDLVKAIEARRDPV